MQPSALLDCVPDPEVIRRRLSELAAEAAFLRQLLRLARKKPPRPRARAATGSRARPGTATNSGGIEP